MQKLLFNVFRDIYYLVLAAFVKIIAYWPGGLDTVIRFLGFIRYHFGYVGFPNGKQFFSKMLEKDIL